MALNGLCCGDVPLRKVQFPFCSVQKRA